jgi:hypothetical protein
MLNAEVKTEFVIHFSIQHSTFSITYPGLPLRAPVLLTPHAITPAAR